MSSQKLTCHVSHPLQFNIGYQGVTIPTSFGLTSVDSMDAYRCFLNHIHYRNNCYYSWPGGLITYSVKEGCAVLLLRAGETLLEFEMEDDAAHSYVERVLYRFLQVAEEVTDSWIR